MWIKFVKNCEDFLPLWLFYQRDHWEHAPNQKLPRVRQKKLRNFWINFRIWKRNRKCTI